MTTAGLLVRVAAVLYVVAPGALVLVSASTQSDAAYVAALVLAMPLSYVANVASYIVAATVLSSIDSNGAPIAAAFMSAAALAQLFLAKLVLNERASARRRRAT